MALKQNKQLKLYYSIREVAEMFGVNESLIRYWEKEFAEIAPKRAGGNIRQYTKEDIESIRQIYYLVKEKGMTLWDAMVAMYEKYGYYKDAVQSIGLKGIEGLAKIQSIMETLRNNTPAEVGGYKVLSARDYKLDTIKDMATGEVKPTGLPSSNVLYYDMEDGAWICVRPSGTEPKIKFYYGIKGTSLEDADAKSEALGKAVMDMVDAMM